LKAAEKALDFAKKARDLAPNDPKIVGILGIAAYQTGNFNGRMAFSWKVLVNSPMIRNSLQSCLGLLQLGKGR
jgi:hypothetical protein